MPRLPRRLRPGEEATLVEHLGELRARLLIALGAIALAFPFAFYFQHELIEWLAGPLPEGRRLVTFGVTEPLGTTVKVCLYAAFAAALPVVLYQLWSFLAPAVAETTQRVVAFFALLATALFAAGVAFGYGVVLPRALDFLTQYNSDVYEIEIRASYYFSFVAAALVGIGLVFEMPIFILALVRLRVLTSDRLRANRRVGIFAVVVFAALLPTVDPLSLALEIVPLVALFEASIWLAVLMERRWLRAETLEAVAD